jgi:hypothetical protein
VEEQQDLPDLVVVVTQAQVQQEQHQELMQLVVVEEEDLALMFWVLLVAEVVEFGLAWVGGFGELSRVGVVVGCVWRMWRVLVPRVGRRVCLVGVGR